jgi:hypothetical protein
LMRVRLRSMVLTVAVIGVFPSSGCNNNANEEGIENKRAENDTTPVFRTYGERAQWQAEQDAKNRPAPKVKAGSSKSKAS